MNERAVFVCVVPVPVRMYKLISQHSNFHSADEREDRMNRPVFVAAAELSYKIGRVLVPDGDFTVEDYY